MFIAATFSIVKDILQVKKNDFMLVQNELLISQHLILELVKGNIFNKKSLGGPNLDDINVFNRYIGSEYLLNKEFAETGVMPKENRTYWFVDTESFKNFDQADFDKQVLNRLNDRPIDVNYTFATQQ